MMLFIKMEKKVTVGHIGIMLSIEVENLEFPAAILKLYYL